MRERRSEATLTFTGRSYILTFDSSDQVSSHEKICRDQNDFSFAVVSSNIVAGVFSQGSVGFGEFEHFLQTL